MLKNISDSELLSSTKDLVAQERRLTARVLEGLEEIERRQLHLARGFSSLFEYCLRELGYSESEAHCRISAMRLSRDVPEAVQAVETGKLSLTNLARAQTYFRQERKAGRPLVVEEKRELLRELEGMSTRECERRLASDSSTRKSFQVDDELLSDLQRIRELWGNQDLGELELLKKMAKVVLGKIDPERQKGRVGQSVGAPQVPQVEEGPPAEMVTPQTRAIPTPTRREVWKRDGGRCTFVDRASGRRCESRYALQFDHLNPSSLQIQMFCAFLSFGLAAATPARALELPPALEAPLFRLILIDTPEGMELASQRKLEELANRITLLAVL